MYCQYCGNVLPDGSQFCHKCGKKQSSVTLNKNKQQHISLKCTECGAVMVPHEEEYLCPYCGNLQKKTESDAVAIEKLRLQEARERRAFQEKNRSRAEEQQKTRVFAANRIHQEEVNALARAEYKREKTRIFSIIVTIFGLILIIGGGYSENPIWLILQMLCFSIYFLMGNQIIPTRNPAIRKLFSTIGFLLIIPVIRCI